MVLMVASKYAINSSSNDMLWHRWTPGRLQVQGRLQDEGMWMSQGWAILHQPLWMSAQQVCSQVCAKSAPCSHLGLQHFTLLNSQFCALLYSDLLSLHCNVYHHHAPSTIDANLFAWYARVPQLVPGFSPFAPEKHRFDISPNNYLLLRIFLRFDPTIICSWEFSLTSDWAIICSWETFLWDLIMSQQ